MAEPNWQYSANLGTNYYRDADGKIHYGDGSSGAGATTWSDGNGRTVYAQNSAGPASNVGGAYRDTGGAAPYQPSWVNWEGGTVQNPNAPPSSGSSGTYGAYQMPGQGQPPQGQGGAVFGGTGGGSGGGVGGGEQNLGMGTPGAAGLQTGGNPYVGQMADAITQQATQAFNRNVLPGIGSQAMATGGYGGSRQGVIEANAMNDLGQNLTNSLAGLQGSAYNTGLNYDLGLRNNNLGFANLDRNINNDNNSWALQGF